jgi:predicted PurR-regulated permease PerM
METYDHVRITGGALKRWLRAVSYDALAMAALWLIGLWIIGVPWAPLWAVLGGLFQFVPQVGLVVALIGPAIAGALSGGWERLLYVLILFAVLALLEGFVLQPLFMKHTARVPIWASIIAPLVLGLFFAWWLVLLAAPLLAILFTYRALFRAREQGVGDPSRPEILPPERAPEGTRRVL